MHVVVPVRSFLGMARLADHVSPETRSELSTLMADRLVASARAAELPVVVVTSNKGVAAWADHRDLDLIIDDGSGLNAAASTAITYLESWAVVHADLPMVTAADLSAVSVALDGNRKIVLSPSHDGGTSVVAARTGTFPFSYGPGSFRRHLAATWGNAVVLVRHGLAMDIDRPHDLAVARRLRALP